MPRVSSAIPLVVSVVLLLPVMTSKADGAAGCAAADRTVRGGAPRERAPLGGPHVRPLGSAATTLVAEGMRRSYTIARLVAAIEDSDLVVYVRVMAPPDAIRTSQTQLLSSSAGGWRYASVLIDKRMLPLQRLEMLGHELQHAAEIAEVRDVIDDDSLQRLYERVGYRTIVARTFETKAAIVAQLRVGQELLASLDSTDPARDARPSAGSSAADRRKAYEAYCAVCHGRNGRGRGPAIEALMTRPPDLTLLAERNGGEFPRSSVEGCIRASARQPLPVPGIGMPVWPPVSHDHDAGAAAHADNIAAYVESLQRRQQ